MEKPQTDQVEFAVAKSEQMDKKAPEQEEEEEEEDEEEGAKTSGMSDVSKSFVEDVIMWPQKRQTQESQDAAAEQGGLTHVNFFSTSIHSSVHVSGSVCNCKVHTLQSSITSCTLVKLLIRPSS